MKLIRLNKLIKIRAAPSSEGICGWVSFLITVTPCTSQTTSGRKDVPGLKISVQRGRGCGGEQLRHWTQEVWGRRSREKGGSRDWRCLSCLSFDPRGSRSTQAVPVGNERKFEKKTVLIACQFQRFQSMVSRLCGRQHGQNVHPKVNPKMDQRKEWCKTQNKAVILEFSGQFCIHGSAWRKSSGEQAEGNECVKGLEEMLTSSPIGLHCPCPSDKQC